MDGGDRKVPIVVNDGRRRTAAIFSPSAHYLDYPLVEISRQSGRRLKAVVRAAAVPWRALFRTTEFDRVVYLNHWLTSGGPPLELPLNSLADLVARVRAEHTGHAVIVPGVVPALTPRLSALLVALGGKFVQSRTVHILDMKADVSGGSRRGIREKRNVDRRYYERFQQFRTSDIGTLIPHVARMRDLYSQLYIRKYSTLNPDYTERFFDTLLRSGEFRAAGWIRDGRLDAFNIQLVQGGVNHWSIFGYDVRAGEKLFRLAAGEEMFNHQGDVVVNWGGGNSFFKKFRGAIPAHEYDVVFDAHLSRARRLPWSIVAEVRGYRNERALAADTKLRPSRLSGEASRKRDVRPTRIALITSIPELVAPFVSAAGNVAIPLAVLIRRRPILVQRLVDLRSAVRKQARINRTSRMVQIINRVAYYRIASTAPPKGGNASDPGEALDLLSGGRRFIEATSINDPSVMAALRDADCDLCLVIGGDVIKRETLASVPMRFINLHLSDPSFARGLPPVFWEIRCGRDEITLTLHDVTPELDAGPVLLQRNVPIDWRPTLAATIAATRESASRHAARLLMHALPRIGDGDLTGVVRPPGPLRTIPPLLDLARAVRVCRKRARSATRT